MPWSLLFACTPGGLGSVTATVSDDIVTVVTVDWTTDEEVDSYVRYGVDLEHQTPVSNGTEHTVPLLGLTGSTELSYQVVIDGDEPVEGPVESVTTGDLPNDLPAFTTDGGSAGAYMSVPVVGGVTAPVILTPEGEVTWYWFDERGLDVYRAFPSGDGTGVYYNAASVSGDPSEASELVHVTWDGGTETTIEVPLLAHDFVEHADGTLGMIVVEYREGEDGEEVKGDQILEIAPDGTQTVVWSAWDCYDPAVHEGDDSGWTFANALDWDEDEQVYYISFRSQSTITKVNRETGACVWAAGESGDIELDEEYEHQHQFQVLESSLLVFDNDGAGNATSRVMEYSLDVEGGEFQEIWSYQSDPPVYSFVLGDVNRFDGGDTLVTWSVAGQIERVGSGDDPEVQFKLNGALGDAFAFNTVLDSLYR